MRQYEAPIILEIASEHLRARVADEDCSQTAADCALGFIYRGCAAPGVMPASIWAGYRKAIRNGMNKGTPGVEAFENAVREWADDLALPAQGL